jgi:hypothetical protein
MMTDSAWATARQSPAAVDVYFTGERRRETPSKADWAHDGAMVPAAPCR